MFHETREKRPLILGWSGALLQIVARVRTARALKIYFNIMQMWLNTFRRGGLASQNVGNGGGGKDLGRDGRLSSMKREEIEKDSDSTEHAFHGISPRHILVLVYSTYFFCEIYSIRGYSGSKIISFRLCNDRTEISEDVSWPIGGVQIRMSSLLTKSADPSANKLINFSTV